MLDADLVCLPGAATLRTGLISLSRISLCLCGGEPVEYPSAMSRKFHHTPLIGQIKPAASVRKNLNFPTFFYFFGIQMRQ